VCVRDGEVCNVFNNRKEAIKYLKSLLKQSLNDYDKQDKTNEYTYSIKIPSIEIKPIKKRNSFLGL
jgi:hypothetical protein